MVLTKVKSLRNCQERRQAGDARGPDATEAAELLHAEASDDASAVFPEPQRTGLYKFESEDSGVELPSGANSPSTPTSSEQSFALHSRKSSCDSPNLNSASAAFSDELAALAQEDPRQADSTDESATRDAEEDSPATSGERSDEDGAGTTTSGPSRGDGEECGQLEGGDSGGAVGRFAEQRPGVERDSTTDQRFEHPGGDGDTQSLEEYMEQCCRLSEVSCQKCFLCLANAKQMVGDELKNVGGGRGTAAGAPLVVPGRTRPLENLELRVQEA